MDELIERGEVQFVVTIPATSRAAWCAASSAQMLVEADATDPVATGGAVWPRRRLPSQALTHDLNGPLAALRDAADAVRGRRAAPLQPRGHHALQHRARPAGRRSSP